MEDSFEGNIEYYASNEPGVFEVTGAFRHGNAYGQGGVRVIGQHGEVDVDDDLMQIEPMRYGDGRIVLSINGQGYLPAPKYVVAMFEQIEHLSRELQLVKDSALLKESHDLDLRPPTSLGFWPTPEDLKHLEETTMATAKKTSPLKDQPSLWRRLLVAGVDKIMNALAWLRGKIA